MTKTPFVILFLLAICQHTYSQKNTEDFVISMPEQKVAHSLYNEITLLDSRLDTTSLGMVQLGAFNRLVHVIPKKHLSLQLSEMLRALNDDAAENGKLLFHIRHLNFSELTGKWSERGFCLIRAELYSNSNDVYKMIGRIDTVVFVKSMDVTRALFRRTSKLFADFISTHLDKKPGDDAIAYLIGDVKNLDKLEKKSIPLYNTHSFTNGLYLSYESFAKQTPDYQVTVEFKKEKLRIKRILDANGKSIVLKATDVYAVVDSGAAYANTGFGYSKITKRDGDFYFIGKSKINMSGGEAFTMGMMYGLLGSMLIPDKTATFEMKIDHLNGGFIKIKEKAEFVRGG
jgi:hypothetical protein